MIEGRKEERAAAKLAASDAAKQLDLDYERCAEKCVCGATPCPAAGLQRCGTCRAAGRLSLKPRLCVVRECVAARKGPQPLALTYQPPTPVLLALGAATPPVQRARSGGRGGGRG